MRGESFYMHTDLEMIYDTMHQIMFKNAPFMDNTMLLAVCRVSDPNSQGLMSFHHSTSCVRLFGEEFRMPSKAKGTATSFLRSYAYRTLAHRRHRVDHLLPLPQYSA